MIRVENLSYVVGQVTVLSGVSFEVQEAEIFSLLGPSGCGKTTLLKCLAGLLRPTSGHIYLNGREITGLTETQLNEVRRDIGLVFQYAALFDSMTVGENIAFALERLTALKGAEIQARVRENLALVGLAGLEDRYPAQLSGGMRKRVGLARAIASQPRIMLYDEPSSGLDPVSAAGIDELIVQMRDRLRVTSVIVSHHIQNVFRITDRVALLYRGNLLAVGSPRDFEESDHPLVRQFIEGRSHGPMTDLEGEHATDGI